MTSLPLGPAEGHSGEVGRAASNHEDLVMWAIAEDIHVGLYVHVNLGLILCIRVVEEVGMRCIARRSPRCAEQG